jgi:hypothetical protein
MKLTTKPLAFCIPFLGVLTAHPGFAFSIFGDTQPDPALIYPNPRLYRSISDAQGRRFIGQVQTSVIQPLAPPQQNSSFLNILQSSFSSADGWTFTTAQQNLTSSFWIKEYNPFSFQQYNEEVNREEPTVGANLYLRHVDSSTGQQLSSSNFHWIQVFSDSFKSGVDIASDQSNPFYDLIPDSEFSPSGENPATSSQFIDAPRIFGTHLTRPQGYNFSANLYLAEVTNPVSIADFGNSNVTKNVTLHNGVAWGYRAIPRRIASDGLDLALLFDTTGSTGDDIGRFKQAAAKIVNELFTEVPDTRVAVADYRDFPTSPYGASEDYSYQPRLSFSSDISSIVGTVNGLSSDGGGDFPESAYTALINAIQGQGIGDWRTEAKKSIILFTDAPPHDPEPFTGYTAQSVIDASLNSPFSADTFRLNSDSDLILRGSDFSIFSDELDLPFQNDPISIYNVVLGGNATALNSFGEISQQTGGQLYTSTNIEDGLRQALTDIREDLGLPLFKFFDSIHT